MSTVIQVEIPEAFRQVLAEERGEATLPRWALEALVAEAVREGLISSGRGGEILGLSFQQREAFYTQRGVVHDYSDEELREQQRAIEMALAR